MNIEKMREEFEVWARKMSMDLEYRNIPGVGQFYECPRTLLAFEAWQASRESLVIDLSSVIKTTALPNRKWFLADGVLSAIEAAGVKVKS